jgi:hypothetical protein
MIGTEILELRAVLEHVVDGREQRGRNRAGCLFRTAATSEPIKLGVEVAALLAPSPCLTFWSVSRCVSD